jgi:hypothetical protein
MSENDLRARLTALVAEMRADTHWNDPAGWYADRLHALLREPPESPGRRAHVPGCRHALSVPVARCVCGGRDVVPR